jgi:lysophospholipase L1-like esterase
MNRSRRVALSLLGIFACVLAADVGLRVLEPYELHRDWEHPVIGAKEALYEKFSNSDVDALIVGSSLTMNLDAKRIGEASGYRVFNGSIAGLTASGISAVMREAYAPTRKPRLVIYPLSMRDLRKRERPFDRPPFLSHKMRAERPVTWQDRVEIEAERVSYLFRIRRQVRHDLLEDEREQRTFPLDAYGTRNHARHLLQARLKNPRFLKEYYRDMASEGEAFGDTADADELTKMIRANKRDGIQTVLVNMVLSPAAISGKLARHYKTYVKQSKALAKREGVPWYDAHDELDLSNAYFNDLVHTGAKGDKRVEDYLVTLIQRHLSDEPPEQH